jgi:argininosuccinate lyase
VPEYAPELIEGAFAIEVADAELLHHPLDYADLAHVLVLRERGIGPDAATARLLGALLDAHATPVAEFDYDPSHGEIYNCREDWLAARIGNDAGWLHAGRPRREAVRIALRLRLRRDVLDLLAATAGLVVSIGEQADKHAETYLAEQTYLQHAQPSTFGHFLLGSAYPALRDLARLEDAYAWLNRSPGGAGGVNGSALTGDRETVANLLAFDGVIEHTRDAMWQTDGYIALLSAVSSLAVTSAKLAEDLEIWASNEFDYVRLADGHSRTSVLMPNKRNPYALTMIRGEAGILIGRLTGMLAVTKSPSARSDNLIFAYGEVPRALDLAVRQTRLMAGVVAGLTANADRMYTSLETGYAVAADLAEHLMLTVNIDYRTSYRIVGAAVRAAAAAGIRGVDMTGDLLAKCAIEVAGEDFGLAALDLRPALDPRAIVGSRVTRGGAEPGVVRGMAADVVRDGRAAADRAVARRRRLDAAEGALLEHARRIVAALD